MSSPLQRAVAVLGVCVFVLPMLLLTGCTTPSQSTSSSVNPRAAEVGDEYATRKSVDRARRAIEAGDHYMMIPRLQDTIARYRDTEAAKEAFYFLGIAYYHIGGYRDAIEAFDEYMRLAPDGRYAAESAEYAAKLTQEYKQKFITPEQLDLKIDELRGKLEKEPQFLADQWKLAGLLWKRGNYEQAAKLYMALVARHPEYANDATFKNRIELLPDNQYVILTPAEILHRHAEAQPLAIINEATFRAGRDLFTRVPRYYVVTGQVVNRSDSVLYGVQVIVTLYGVGGVVYDTNTVNIGRLNPKEIRAFSVRFSNFENISNISRHECVGMFQR